MAEAKKCDRCGIFYDQFVKGHTIPTMIVDGGESVIYIMACYRDRRIDLCPACSKAFHKFINNKDWRA